MSFSFEASFRSRESARRTVLKDPGLPEPVRDFLLTRINALSYDTDDRYIYVKAQGHLMVSGGGNSYERSSGDLLVEPRYFAPAPTYGRTTA